MQIIYFTCEHIERCPFYPDQRKLLGLGLHELFANPSSPAPLHKKINDVDIII